MAVVMKGGTSGCRKDYLAPVPDSGSPQPILRTETSGSIPPNIQWGGGLSGNRFEDYKSALPTGGTIPTGSTDIEDPRA
jgi:hypothetical protein